MTITYYMSDPHDGHKKIGEHRSKIIPEVTCVESNREFIRNHWRAGTNDKVIIVGDVAFTQESILFWKSLPGEKEIMLGNHDLENCSRPDIHMLASAFSKICGVRSQTFAAATVGEYKFEREKMWIQHIPMHPLHLRGRRQIHGHEHLWQKDHMNPGSDRFDENYINVNMDVLWPRTGKIMLSTDELRLYASGKL